MSIYGTSLAAIAITVYRGLLRVPVIGFCLAALALGITPRAMRARIAAG